MATRTKYRVNRGALYPIDQTARNEVARLADGEVVELHMWKLPARDVVSNILGAVFQKIAAAKHWRVSTARSLIMLMTGRFELVDLHGRKLPIAWSQGDMRSDDLTAFADDAAEAITCEILPGLREDKRDEISELLGKLK